MESSFKFDDENTFLSNFYRINLEYKGFVYKSAEHLYQVAKCQRKCDRDKLRKISSPKMVKIYGRFFESRSNWDEKRKTKVMEKIVQAKFNQPELKKLLQATGDTRLIHINYLHDTFWGVCTCTKHKRTGQNMLGNILMKIRDKIV